MNLNETKHPKTVFDREAKMSGVGANALWNGPFDTTGYPKGQGSSSGKNGIKLRFADPKECGCDMPITSRAKTR